MYVLAWLAVFLVSGFVALQGSEETGEVVFVILALSLTVWGVVANRGSGGRGGSSGCGSSCGGCGGGD